MNILHVTTYVQGGAGRIIKDLLICQKKRGHHVYLVINEVEESGYLNYPEYLEAISEEGIEVFRVHSTFKRDIYLNLIAADSVRKVLLEKSIDMIHTHAAVPSLVSIIARSSLERRIPILQTLHGWGLNKNPTQERMDVTIMNSIDKTIGVSYSEKSLVISKGTEPSQIDVIYNGIEDQKSVETAEDDVVKIMKSKSEAGYTVIGCIGTVCSRKNQELVLMTLSKHHQFDKLFFLFIGDSEKEKVKELTTFAKENSISESIYFAGYRENASNYLRCMDFLILPSLSEGLGIAIIEGFRARIPVLSSSIEPFKELIVDGETGFIFNNDPDSLFQKLQEVVNLKIEEKHRITEKAYAFYKNSFTLNSMLDNYQNAYEKLQR